MVDLASRTMQEMSVILGQVFLLQQQRHGLEVSAVGWKA